MLDGPADHADPGGDPPVSSASRFRTLVRFQDASIWSKAAPPVLCVEREDVNCHRSVITEVVQELQPEIEVVHVR